MNIKLPADAAQFIEGLVASGEYQSADESVTEGVRLLMCRNQMKAENQKGIDELDADQLRNQVAVGIDQADCGDIIDHDTMFADLRARAANIR